MIPAENIQLLAALLTESSLRVSSEAVNTLEEYRRLLLCWNSRMNLISKKDEARIIRRHFLDSIGLAEVLSFPVGARIMDAGSGPGFPGIPLKIIRPDLDMTLVDSRKKKTVFLKEAVDKLEIQSCRIINERVESISQDIEPFDFILSRAVADCLTLWMWTARLLKPVSGRMIVIKGPAAYKEAEALEKSKRVNDLGSVEVLPYDPFSVSVRDEQSYLVIIKKQKR